MISTAIPAPDLNGVRTSDVKINAADSAPQGGGHRLDTPSQTCITAKPRAARCRRRDAYAKASSRRVCPASSLPRAAARSRAASKSVLRGIGMAQTPWCATLESELARVAEYPTSCDQEVLV